MANATLVSDETLRSSCRFHEKFMQMHAEQNQARIPKEKVIAYSDIGERPSSLARLNLFFSQKLSKNSKFERRKFPDHDQRFLSIQVARLSERSEPRFTEKVFPKEFLRLNIFKANIFWLLIQNLWISESSKSFKKNSKLKKLKIGFYRLTQTHPYHHRSSS